MLVILGVFVASVFVSVSAQPNYGVNKKGWHQIGCRGYYDRDDFEDLNDVCNSCAGLYRKSVVAVACRAKCFHNNVFKECLSALVLNNAGQLKQMAADLRS